MQVVIKDHETCNLMHGNTKLSPEAFAEAFRRGYPKRFSYKIIFVDVTRNDKHRVFRTSMGIDPQIVSDWIRSTAGESRNPARRLAA